MHVHAIVNRKAGGVIDMDGSAVEDHIRNAFASAGHTTAVELVEPENVETAMDRAVSKRPDVLLVGGGDGTVRSAAAKLIGTTVALGILPLGTINRLARDLGIPLTMPEALKALASGSLRAIDAADVNGDVFLCNSLIGLPPTISEERQKLRGKQFWVRSAGYIRLLRVIAASHKKIELTVNDEDDRRLMRVLSLAVSNNPYGEAPSLVLTRPVLDSGELGLYISKHDGGLGLLWVLAKAAMGRWKGDPNLDRLTAKRITITSRRSSIRVANDGEVNRLRTPLIYSIKPKALQLLAPVKL